MANSDIVPRSPVYTDQAEGSTRANLNEIVQVSVHKMSVSVLFSSYSVYNSL